MAQSITEKDHKPLTEREKWLASQVVEIAITIHRFLGPGLLENIYEKCFCYELTKRNIPFSKQKCVDQETYHPVWEAQLLSYLRLTNKRLGYILNFHVPLMKDGLKRMIL